MADFTDIPQGHWAQGSIFKLISAEIISGYTDGSFKGDKKVSRYELSKMISPMASILGDISKIRRGKDELSSDGALLFYSFKNPINFELSGKMGFAFIYDNQSFETTSSLYSIQASLVKELGSLSQLEINLDTDPVIYNTNKANGLMNLLTVTGRSHLGTIDLSAVYGPGRVANSANPLASLGSIFDKPNPSLSGIYSIGNFSLLSGITFISDSSLAKNIITTSGQMAINKSTSIFITPQLITGTSYRNIEGTLTYLMKTQNSSVQLDLFSEGSSLSDSNGYKLRLNGKGKDSVFDLSLIYFGSNCNINGPLELFPLTIFNTPIFNGFTGGSISIGRKISDKNILTANLELVGDKNFSVGQSTPGTFTSTSLSLKREVRDNIDLYIFYRNTSLPSQQIYIDRTLTNIGKDSVSTYGISITARL